MSTDELKARLEAISCLESAREAITQLEAKDALIAKLSDELAKLKGKP